MTRYRYPVALAAAVAAVAALSLPAGAAAGAADPPVDADPPAAAEETAAEAVPAPGEAPAPDPSPATGLPATPEPEPGTVPEPDPELDTEPDTEPDRGPAGPDPETHPHPPTDAVPSAPAEAAAPEAASDAVAAEAVAARKPQPKVTICHRTNSRTNPYNLVVVSRESAIDGHAAHVGPIFSPDVDSWGDIIPPLPGLPAGRNWPEGRSVLDNGCELPPDVGPVPAAAVGDVTCDTASASVVVTVTNRPRATAPAKFTILVDGTAVQTVGPVPPGESEEVVLDDDLDALEDQTFTIEVTSGGEVLATRVVTVDCAPVEPSVEIAARLACVGTSAQGTDTVTNNGPDPVTVTTEVDGEPVGDPVVVAPGDTETGGVDLSAYEDQTVDVDVLVDGAVVAGYVVTPDCIAPQSQPRVSVAGVECPPPTATVTLGNAGDADSRIVYAIRVDGRLAQVSAPIYGGDTTTIVADLTPYEDQRVTVRLSANGQVLGTRTLDVDCVQEAGENDAESAEGDEGDEAAGTTDPAGGSAGVPTVVPAGVPPATDREAGRPVVVPASALLALGSLLLLGVGLASRLVGRGRRTVGS